MTDEERISELMLLTLDIRSCNFQSLREFCTSHLPETDCRNFCIYWNHRSFAGCAYWADFSFNFCLSAFLRDRLKTFRFSAEVQRCQIHIFLSLFVMRIFCRQNSSLWWCYKINYSLSQYHIFVVSNFKLTILVLKYGQNFSVYLVNLKNSSTMVNFVSGLY